ncbi:MAG: DNA polymerase I [Anaerolineales bacterium]|nr:DNA polymerase I [Anaerolineales bacterium]
MPPVLYLIDGHALAYRTYFALTSGSGTGFRTHSGEPTAGVFGFTSVLLRLLEQEKPEYLAVAFDTGRTFRDDLFPAYKGTREKMPDDLRVQIERIRQIVDVFNIPRLELEGYEADDVLGSAARAAVEQGLGVKIITGDRDLLQLVSPRVIVSLPGKSLSDSKDYLPEDVEAYLGVRPDQVVDFKALVGDKSDNIPGVAGIGEKTAVNLLKSFDTLDGVYAHLDEAPAGVRKKLEAGRETAYLSYKLALIVTNLDIPLDLEQAHTSAFDVEKVEGLFRELEFRTLMTRLAALTGASGQPRSAKGEQLDLFGGTSAAAAGPAVRVSGSQAPAAPVIDTPEKLAELVRRLSEADEIAFDTETTSTDQMQAELVGIALATSPDEGVYIPLGHRGADGKQLPLESVLEALRGPLTDPAIRKSGHNLKYDYVILCRNGLQVAPLSFDTMIAEWLTDPASHNLGLKNLAWVRKGFRMTNIEELIGKGRSQISMAQVPVQAAADYAALDVRAVLMLEPELAQELEQKHAAKLFHDLEMPLAPVLADMEMTGVALDVRFLREMSGELSERLLEIDDRICREVGEKFNLNSPQQLSTALFERLKIEPPDRTQKTASGFYSTSAGVLENLRGQHPVVDWVLEYRELSKLKSTYLDALPAQVDPVTGRVHTSFNQTGSVTGRLASSDPNLQNIPIRSELGRKVRRAFVAAPGKLLVGVDYSQIELRIVAHMAEDQAMLEAFWAGQDIHAATAAAIYGVPLEAVTGDQRRRAKAINFGLIYGMSPFGLTRYTDLTLAEAENFVKAYFAQFPGVKSYLDEMRRLAAERGFVETLLGRRRYFPGLKTANFSQRNREEREAINAPIQGTAADIMKIAMLRLPSALQGAGLSGYMILQVHDELVLECPKAEARETAALVSKVMGEAFKLKVPLTTEARTGPDWGDMEKQAP